MSDSNDTTNKPPSETRLGQALLSAVDDAIAYHASENGGNVADSDLARAFDKFTENHPFCNTSDEHTLALDSWNAAIAWAKENLR